MGGGETSQRLLTGMRSWTILHTESSTGWSGQQIRILDEARGLMDRGHSVTVVCQPNSMIAKRAEEWNVPIVTTKMKGAFDIVGIRNLRAFMQEYKPQIVNTHSSRDSWTGLIAARLTGGITAVRTRHDHSPIKTSFDSRLLYCKLCDVVVTTGETIRQYVIQQTGSSPDRVFSIPTGIDTRKFSPDNADGLTFRREIGVAERAPLIGTAAVVMAVRGLSHFVEAASKIASKMPDARFVIVGDASTPNNLKERLVEHIAELGMTDKLVLAGSRSDMPNVMAALDVFVLASLSEGLPRVISQAMAMKKPVVAANVGSIPEQVLDGQTGILVEKANSDQIADAVVKIMNDPALAKQMGENGRKLVVERFCVESMLDTTEALYSRLLAPEGA